MTSSPASVLTPRSSSTPIRTGSSATWRRPFPRLPLFLVFLGGALTALSIGLPNIAPGVEALSAIDSPVRQFFAVSKEMNLPTFFSVLLAVGACVGHVVAGRLLGGALGKAFYVTGALIGAMAFDDFTALHERLDGIGGALASGRAGYMWVLPGLIPAAAVVVAFW